MKNNSIVFFIANKVARKENVGLKASATPIILIHIYGNDSTGRHLKRQV